MEPVEDEATPFDADADSDEAEDEEDDDEELPSIIDLSGVQAASYEVIPKGWYSGYIDSVEYGPSQSSGAPMLTFQVKFDYEDADGETKERTLRYYATLAGEAAGRTKTLLATLDPELDLSQLDPEAMDEHFGAMMVKIRVTIRPDRDNRKIKRNNIAEMVPDEDAEDDD